MISQTSKHFSPYYLLFILTLTVTIPVSWAPMPLDKGELMLYRPLIGQSQSYVSHHTLPIHQEKGQKVVIGIKYMEIQDSEHSGAIQNYGLDMRIQKGSGKKLSCILRQENLGLIKFEVSYLKLNIETLIVLRLKQQIKICNLSQENQVKTDSHLWNQVAHQNTDEYNLDSKIKLMTDKFRGLAFLRGYKLSTTKKNEFQLNMEVTQMNMTHLTFKNQFRQVQSITFDLLYFREIDLYYSMLDFKIETRSLHYENSYSTKESKTDQNAFYLLGIFQQKPLQNSKLSGFTIQLNKLIELKFIKMKCQKGYYWDIQENECVQQCSNNFFQNSQACLKLQSKHGHLSDQAEQAQCNEAQQMEATPLAYPKRFLCQYPTKCSKIDNCESCTKRKTGCGKICESCQTGAYLGYNGMSCNFCSSTCKTCNTYYTNGSPQVNCTSCINNLTLIGPIPFKCACPSSQFMVSNTCINCPNSCSTCTSLTTCLTCKTGYYRSGELCLKCLAVCNSCMNAATCTSCDTSNGLVLNSLNLCVCTSPYLLNPTTPLTCSLCSSLYSNCLACSYSPAYSSSIPSSVVCSSPAPGYFLSGSGTAACGTNCKTCTSNTVCTGCTDSSMDLSLSCSCPALTYLTNATPLQCLSCSTIFPGCDTCSYTTSTTCTACLSGYYPTSAVPIASCLKCSSTCATCTNNYGCDLCVAGMHPNPTGSFCLCDAGFLDPITQTCVACDIAIVKCNTCLLTLPTTCQTCDTGYYLSPADTTKCLACPLNCQSCDNLGVCGTCNLGFQPPTSLNGFSCLCDATCHACNTTTSLGCVSCTGTTCNNAQAGYYVSTGSPQPCMAECSACLDGLTCSSCDSPFILTSTLQCVCNSTSNLYKTLDGLSCQTCASIFPNCLSCQSGPTTCQTCAAGKFFDGTSCTGCSYPCVTCTGSATSCNTCQAPFTYLGVAGNCVCDNTTLWYSNITLTCVSCSQLINNCQTCQIDANPAYTKCTLCDDPYFADPITGTCKLCDTTCASCDSSACNLCSDNNLVASGLVCVPNTGLDANLAYYGPTNSAVSCLSLLTNCLACTPSPLSCSSCGPNTFPSGTTCVICSSTCASCDVNGCTSCPNGTTLDGTTCICTGACTTCQNSIANCLTCTISGVTASSCLSCATGYYLSNNLCQTCPTGCAACTSDSTCTVCLSTFTLSSGSCNCDETLNLYRNGLVCQLCSTVVYGCSVCTTTASSTTACDFCNDGFYLTSNGQCNPCKSSCATCTNSTLCTSCPSGYTLGINKNCDCGPTCLACNSIRPNCASCTLTGSGVFARCDSCAVGFYLDSTSNQCMACPSSCTTCGAGGVCISCPITQEVVSGICQCNLAKGLTLNTVTNICVSCTATYSNCLSCVSNASAASGFSCGVCESGYYYHNDNCQFQQCGDGLVTINEECDDGNNQANDGCYQCKLQKNYKCQGSPSICFMSTDFKITFDSLVVSSVNCNELTINFAINPVSQQYGSADFNLMLVAYQNSNITNKPQKTGYRSGIVSYTFSYFSQIQGDKVKFYFVPSLLGIPSTAEIGYYPLFFSINGSDNSILLRHYSQEQCNEKKSVATIVSSVQLASYGVLILSALPSKIVGLQLFGVLQLSFLTLGNIDNLNPLLASFTQLSVSNGLNLEIDDKQKTKSRRLQSAALTPSRVQTIGYSSNFLRNCNLMLFIVYSIMLASFILYLLTHMFQKCAPSLFSLSKRIFKQVLLTLILFNCFNFAYSSGLHFAYADHDDSLYILGTIAATTTIIIPLVMIAFLQCTEQQGFGEYKEKLKPGCLQRSYFTITIVYRMGIGYYTATMNESELSTLIVLALSLLFLLYNLVNLPFRKAYHNYRANICHFTQFICLFVGMYYRSMKRNTPVDDVNSIVSPVYFQLVAIAVSLIASVIILFYEIYVWIVELKNQCCKKTKVEEGQGNSLAKFSRQDDVKQENNQTIQVLEQQPQQIEFNSKEIS